MEAVWLTDSTFKSIPAYCKEYLKARFALKTLIIHAYPGFCCDQIFGNVDQVSHIVSDDINYLFISAGQNDVSFFVDRFKCVEDVSSHVCRFVQHWLCNISLRFPHLKVVFFPLYLRKLNILPDPQLQWHFDSKQENYIYRVNEVIRRLNSALNVCTCHSHQIFLIKATRLFKGQCKKQ